MTAPTVAAVIDALQLPASCRVDQRVPKKMLVEYGAPTAADKRLLTDGIEDIQWIAALKPSNVAIPEYRGEGREYLEVAVLCVQTRANYGKASQVQRLAELVHRAVPYPMLLIQGFAGPSADRLALSLAHKRAAQNETGKVVLDGEMLRFDLNDTRGPASPITAALVAALAVSRQPHRDLMALYQGWIDCLTAAEVASVTGSFQLATDVGRAASQRVALRTCQRLEQEKARLRSLAEKERQIAKQVELNLALQSLQADLNAARALL